MVSASQGVVSEGTVNANINEHLNNDNELNNKTSTLADEEILANEAINDSIIEKDDFVEQINSLQTDIDAGLLNINIQPGKQPAKNRQLKEECFDLSIYKQKQCGFTTSRPMFWLQSIDEYVKNMKDTVTKFYYMSTKNSKGYTAIKRKKLGKELLL